MNEEVQNIRFEEVGPVKDVLVKKLTRAEAERQVREIKKTCRGLPAIPVFEMRAKLFNDYKAAEANHNWNAAYSQMVETEKTAGVLGKAVQEGEWEKLNSRFHSAVFAHGDQTGKPCGADFNDIICAGAFDGKQHAYTCPKCGQTGHYGAPYFDVAE
jgi:hypothetical protein